MLDRDPIFEWRVYIPPGGYLIIPRNVQYIIVLRVTLQSLPRGAETAVKHALRRPQSSAPALLVITSIISC